MITDEDAINEFINDLSSVKNYSDNTIESYKNDISEFQAFLKNEKMARGLLFIRNKVAQNYVYYLSGKNLASTSIHRKISSLSSFYDFLVKEEMFKENFFKDLDEPKIPKRLVQVISTDEISMLMSSCDLDNKLGYRNYCILGCLFGCGLRVSELCNLKVQDIRENMQIIGK